jgi:large subunit ribosomal protein L30
MIAVIRIRGEVNMNREIKETLNRLRLRKKYSCVIFAKPKKEQLGMIKKVKDFIAFGEISKEMLEKLIEARGRAIDKTKKVDFRAAAKEFSDGKKIEELNIKPFFRLHPPRGGIESKKHFSEKKGKGVLGDNKEKINELIERML